jgi:hypothetical protein
MCKQWVEKALKRLIETFLVVGQGRGSQRSK